MHIRQVAISFLHRADTGFRHVEPTKYKPRLFHFYRDNKVRTDHKT